MEACRRSRLQRLWFNPGPDSGWSWVIVISSLFYSFVLQGIFKAQGYLFVATVDTYGLTREEASWPFVIFFATAHISGVFAGPISHYVSARKIMFFSGILMCSGYMICYLAPASIVWMTIGYGVIAGPNLGITFATQLQIVNEYFEKYRTTANQLLMAGLGLGGLLYPFFIYHLLNAYGLRGTFLTLSAFTMHTFVAAALLRPRSDEQFPSLKPQQPQVFTIETQEMPTRNPPDVALSLDSPKNSGYLNLLRELLVDPMYYIITVSSFCDIVAWGVFFMTVVDYAIDNGMTSGLATMLLPAHSGAELVVRLCTGWITDNGYVSVKVFHLASVVLTGVFFCVYPLVRGNIPFFVFACVLGCLYGTSTGSRLVIYVEYLDVRKMPTANGSLLFLAGIAFLGTPKLLGLLRDSFGSYDFIYLAQGSLCLLSALVWIFEPGFLSKPCKTQQSRNKSDKPPIRKVKT